MDPVARKSMAAGSGHIVDTEGATKILRVPNDYFAPGAVDTINRVIARLLQFKRTAQTLDEYLVRHDLLRRKAESRMHMGGSPPETFAPILCMHTASLTRSDKSLVLASAKRSLGFAAAARQMRRLFAPVGCAVWRRRRIRIRIPATTITLDASRCR